MDPGILRAQDVPDPASGYGVPVKVGLRSGWLRRHPFVADALLALCLFLLALPTSSEAALEDGFRRPNALTVLLVALQTLPLAARRRYPLPVLVVSATGLFLHAALGFELTAGWLGPALSVYTVSARYPRPARSVQITAATGLAVMASPFVYDRRIGPSEFGGVLLIFALPWFVGSRFYKHRAYTAGLEARAAKLEREREEASRRAVDEERARIARELHDVVAHAISVVIVQAGAARRVLQRSPDRADESIAAIETVGRQALGEMRRLLEVLRREHELEAYGPQPGVAQLGPLTEQVREAGLPVELSIEGDVRPLPASIDLSVYRIVQEALTNSLKHAGPARAQVLLRYGKEGLEVLVRDDGRQMRAGANGSGHGLAGMRERVALLGGRLSAGPRTSERGFEVCVELPLDGVEE